MLKNSPWKRRIHFAGTLRAGPSSGFRAATSDDGVTATLSLLFPAEAVTFGTAPGFQVHL
jgi:hypothetical protein